MEMIVVYNAGKAARLKGAARCTPEQIDYPNAGRVHLDGHAKREWLAGFDGKYERRN